MPYAKGQILFTDIRKLRTFVTVVEMGSLTGAAARLNVAQPWISVQIKHLEERLNITLLDRSNGKAVQLSTAGKKFLPVAQRLLAACELAANEIAFIQKETHNKLALGIDPIILYVPEARQLLNVFRSTYPQIALDLISRNPNELFAGLQSGQFDIILTSCPAPDESMEIAPVCEYPLRLFTPKLNSAEYADTSLEGLRGKRILTLPLSYHPPLYSWLRAQLQGADLRYVRCPEDSFHVLLRYAALLGIATFAPDFG
jgi:DNA-binding transcriptional LysR family regulator